MNDSVFLLSEQELALLTLEEKAEYCSLMEARERQRAQLQLRMNELELRMDPTPRQLDFLEAARRHKYVLYGGAAGGGKSYVLRWWLVDFLCRIFRDFGARHVRVGLFCEDYISLRDRQLSKMKFELPSWLGVFRETREEGYAFHLNEEFGGGILCPRNLDDPSKYDSVEFAAIAVDELTKNTIEVFDQLRKRLRWPGLPRGFKFPFVGGTNPAGIGHGWVKRYWLDRDFPKELEAQADEFVFVPARAQDNPHNPESYYSDLLTLPEPMRRAYAEGDWNLFVGQFFSEWRRELHVVRPYAIPDYWRRFWAGDWGYTKPFCGLWFAVSPEGNVCVYRELYVTQKDTQWLAGELKRLSHAERLVYKVLDPACWDPSHGPSIAEQLGIAGWGTTKADNDRTNGWARMREYLAWERNPEGKLIREPQLQVFSTCENLVRTLPALVFDSHNPEDADSDGEDHAPDALRYGLMSRPGRTVVPLEEMPEEYAEALMRLEHAEKRKRGN